MYKLNKGEIEDIESLINSRGWKLFLKILKDNENSLTKNIIFLLAKGKSNEAIIESRKIEYINYLIEKPLFLIKKKKINNKEVYKSEFEKYEESIPDGLI